MKKTFYFLLIGAFVLVINACSSNATSSKFVPPAPKPTTYLDTIAVAAKKADFYVRLAFDLADGYLSDNSVVRKRYGVDGKYVESLEFAQAETTGEIYSSAISAPFFKYRHLNEYDIPTVTVYSELYLLSTRALKRGKVMATAGGATHPSYEYDLKFRNTDITGEQLELPVNFTVPGNLTSKGASMNITTPFSVSVQNSSGAVNAFDVTVNNISGQLKVTGANYVPKPADEFLINSGNITITGTDISVHPQVTYTITLVYSDDKVENKTGNFTGTDGFTANYTINKDLAYYTIGNDQTRKYYAYWDYPL